MKYSHLFATFFKIGLFTIGGGYAMVPMIQEAVVKKSKWLTEEEFIEALALSQSVPGAIAVNSSVYIGYKLKGYKGAIVSALGTALPSFLIILLVSIFFFDFRENAYIEKIFKGIRAAVVSLIALSLFQLFKSVKLKKWGMLVFIAASFLLVVFGINPVWILLSGAAGSIAYSNWKGGDKSAS